jgi:glucosyl-3-phosphoglycerate synthase
VRSIVDDLAGFVHEVLVVDDSSTDATADVARSAGARVVATTDVLSDQPAGSGKGNAMWAGVRVLTGDIVVFCDADLESFTTSYVTRLVEPLLANPDVMLVKAFYQRPVDATGEGGGRTTELMARPLLSLQFPVLATLHQPLSGEFAIRRVVAESVPFVQGYGVEAGLLIDVLNRFGPDALAQVDVGIKRHRHRSLSDLAVQAREIASVILSRSGALRAAPAHVERPPLSSLSATLR